MGTSHRHTPTVFGEPNWGKASASVTSIANAEEELDNLDKELAEREDADDNSDSNENGAEQADSKRATLERIAKRQRLLDSQIRRNYHHAVRNLVRAAGGRGRVSSGGSKAIGHAGVVIAGGLVSAINDIAKNGLSDWLSRRGVHTLEGKSCKDVLDLIREFSEAGVTGL